MAFFFFNNLEETFTFLPRNKNVTYYLSEEGTSIKVSCPMPDWNFGIRFLNETNSVEDFEHSKEESLAPGIHDIFFSASINRQLNISNESIINLIVKKRSEPNLEDLPFSKNYIEQEEAFKYTTKIGNTFEIFIKHQLHERQLYIRFFDDSNTIFEKYISFNNINGIFKLFTWGNDSGLNYQTRVDNFYYQGEQFQAFKFGNMVIREGDMFNPDAVLNSNLTVIPASEKGSISLGLRTRIVEMNVPQPIPQIAGSLNTHLIKKNEDEYIAYAYTVKDGASSLEIVGQICVALVEFLSNLKRGVHGVNLPLLGTGAGGLDPIEVLNIYDQTLNTLPFPIQFIISIPSPEVFQEIRRQYRSYCIPLFHEFRNEKPRDILLIEKILQIEIGRSNFELNHKGDLILLDLQGAHLKGELDFLATFVKLKHLNLNNCRLSDFNFIKKLKALQGLYLRNVLIENYSFLSELPHLECIDLSGQIPGFLELVLPYLGRIKKLWITHNNLESLVFLSQFPAIESLDVGYNIIVNLEAISKLKNLNTLSVSNNQIRDISAISNLKRLTYLDISHNKIDRLNFGRLINRLHFLKIDQNPFLSRFEIVLNEGNNHLGPVQNFILRQAEANKVLVRLPAKVLLLGNHASGKSSLLKYVTTGKVPSNIDSTHIIQIQKYPINRSTMPEAIFYDFGGQDYYHGIYRAFLSGDAVNLILWNDEHNVNAIRTDSKGRTTQDFTLDYWLAQKQYLEVEKFYTQTASTLLIQTHSDQHYRKVHRAQAGIQGIENDFFVCLSNDTPLVSPKKLEERKKALKYLKTSIDVLIEENQVLREEPQWYIDFLLYIIQQNTKADYKGRKVRDLLPYYKRNVPNKRQLLEEDLDQLYKQGLIIYYRDEMPDLVWLNPVALVNHVHTTMLSTEVIEKSEGLIPLDSFAADEQNVVELLIKQKVIFVHTASMQYIVPNFLSLAQHRKAEFELYTFGLGDPLFTLKFKNFLPFGLINQIICFFGDLPDDKKFWRDRLIFTLENKAKILINIDFQHLEIKVYASFINNLASHERQEITKYLFYGIVGLYWDLNLLRFKDYVAYVNGTLKLDSFAPEDPVYDKIVSTNNFYENRSCRPIDLFISVNQIDFVNYSDLCDVETAVSINSYSVNDVHHFDGKSKTIPIYQFQPFTLTDLNRRKNVAISYSKLDLELVNKFKDYLIPLYENELINHPWYCTELLAGTEWDQEIQKKFDMADIVFFMISENLMATRYVLDNEIKNAIDKYNKGVKIKIVPILMVPYHFQRNGTYDLSKFTALPYSLKPITLFDNENLAWHTVSESIRIMIEKDLDPGKSDELPKELRKYFEDIIGKSKKDKPKTKK